MALLTGLAILSSWGPWVAGYLATMSEQAPDKRLFLLDAFALIYRAYFSFIRAPRVAELGPDVEVLAELDGEPVLVRDGRVLLASFHPELTDDTRIHERFLQMVREEQGVRA